MDADSKDLARIRAVAHDHLVRRWSASARCSIRLERLLVKFLVGSLAGDGLVAA